jgi:hypothetical protein
VSEFTAEGGNHAADDEAKADTNGQVWANDLSDLPADFGKATSNGHAADGLTDRLGRKKGDEGYNPFDNQRAADKHAAGTAAQAVTEKRLQRWGSRRYALSILDERTELWARKLTSGIERRNAGRDPTKDLPEVMFSGDKAVKAGATDAAIAALPELTTDEIRALRIDASAMLEATRMQVRERGRQIAAAAEVAGYANITTRVDLSTYAPPDDPWTVDGLIPLGKSMGLFSERKAGKTTTIVDLVRSLVTSGKFLGRLATRLPADADVVLLDTEMGADMMQYEFSVAGVSDPALLCRVNYHDLFGRSAMLDMRTTPRGPTGGIRSGRGRPSSSTAFTPCSRRWASMRVHRRWPTSSKVSRPWRSSAPPPGW